MSAWQEAQASLAVGSLDGGCGAVPLLCNAIPAPRMVVRNSSAVDGWGNIERDSITGLEGVLRTAGSARKLLEKPYTHIAFSLRKSKVRLKPNF
jgi:hypothetical protein